MKKQYIKLDYYKLFKNIVSKDELKSALMGVYYDNKEKVFVATNGHILFKIESKNIEINFESEKDGAIIPIRFFQILQLLERQHKYIPRIFEIGITEKHASIFDTIQGIVIYREELIGWQFPNWKSAIPELDKDMEEDREIGLNSGYFRYISLAIKQPGVIQNISFRRKNNIGPILIQCESFNNTFGVNLEIILMPVRLHS